MLLGVTGNYGVGKSTVCDILSQNYNLRLLNADEYAHKLYAPDGVLFHDITNSFDVVVNGKIDRKKLGNIVFRYPDMKKKLDNIMWPIMSEYFENTKDYDVLEAAVLFEAGWDKFVDYKMLVYIPEEKCLETISSRGRDESLMQKVLKYQWLQEFKRELSDFVIDNSDTLSYTRKQIDEAMIKIGIKYL